MKKMLLSVLMLSVLFAASVSAVTYSYSTDDLNSMTHNRAYTWGLNTQWGPGETITGAVLTFHDIYDWTQEVDRLFITLLDNATLGVSSIYDGESPINDYFAGTGTTIGFWFDPNGGPANKQTISFTFDAVQIASLASYSADGVFGIAADPDCHYYSSGTSFEVTTSTDAVPEPTTLLLLGLGITGLGFLRRK